MSVIVMATTLMVSLSTTTIVCLPWIPENYLALLMFFFMGVDCMLAVVTSVGGMAGVYTESVRVTKMLEKSFGIIGGRGFTQIANRGRLEVKRKLRFYRSCIPIKIQFATINFVDWRTPLACVNFANELTLQFLLLGK